MGAILLMEAPILEGPPAQISYCCIADLVDSRFARLGDVAACRSDPTFTRASPGLAVATGNSLKLGKGIFRNFLSTIRLSAI